MPSLDLGDLHTLWSSGGSTTPFMRVIRLKNETERRKWLEGCGFELRMGVKTNFFVKTIQLLKVPVSVFYV